MCYQSSSCCEDKGLQTPMRNKIDQDHSSYSIRVKANTTVNTALQHKSYRCYFRTISFIFIGACLLISLSRPLEKRIKRSTSYRALSLTLPQIKIKNFFRHLEDENEKNEYAGYYDDEGKEEENNYYEYQAGDDQSADDIQDNANDVDDTVDDQGKNNNYYHYTSKPTNSPTSQPTASQDDDFFRYIDDDIDERKILPLELADLAGLLCAALCMVLAVGGGIGPGATLVAIYIIILDFAPRTAIPLSSITCLGVSLAGAMNNVNRRHPLTDRPIIDWDLILIMEPVTLLGAIAGTYVNKLLQEKFIVVMLVLLLSMIAHNTLKRARKMHHAEELFVKRILWAQSKRNKESQIVQASSFGGGLAEADPPFVPKIHPSPRNHYNRGSPQDTSQHSVDSLTGGADRSEKSSISSIVIKFRKKDTESVKSSLLEEEADPLPQHKISYVVAMFLFVIAMNVFKGGGAFESPLGVYCGSISFWIVEFLTACWLVGCTYLAGRYLLRRNAIKEAVGFDYVRGDIRWDMRTLVVYPFSCLIAGLLSGTFGIGCPVVIAPMLIGIGVNPSVAAATSGMMNFFTSLAAASSYAVLGSLSSLVEYAYLCLILGFTATFIGGKLMARRNASTRKLNQNARFGGIERSSYMTYSMGMVLLVSALSMTVEALLSVVSHRFDDSESEGICNVERLN